MRVGVRGFEMMVVVQWEGEALFGCYLGRKDVTITLLAKLPTIRR